MQNLLVSDLTKTKVITEFQLEPTANRCSADMCSKEKFQPIAKWAECSPIRTWKIKWPEHAKTVMRCQMSLSSCDNQISCTPCISRVPPARFRIKLPSSKVATTQQTTTNEQQMGWGCQKWESHLRPKAYHPACKIKRTSLISTTSMSENGKE